VEVPENESNPSAGLAAETRRPALSRVPDERAQEVTEGVAQHDF